jgi:hypothetical protein
MTVDGTSPGDSGLHLPCGAASDAPEVYAAFGLAAHYGEVVAMLRLRSADDTWRAFPYYALAEVGYEPALGVELQFHSAVVCLRGRNLFPLFTQLADHAVRWCWEADRAARLLTPESAPLIERIEVGVRTGGDGHRG